MHFRSTLKSSRSFIDLTPLVDVVFLLLIFFIITSDILPLKSLNIENPTLDKDSPPLATQLLVLMDAHQVIYLGARKEIVDLETLHNRLLEELGTLRRQSSSGEPTVVLSVDRNVDYGSFLQLFSSVQDCGHRVRLVYQPNDHQTTELIQTLHSEISVQ